MPRASQDQPRLCDGILRSAAIFNAKEFLNCECQPVTPNAALADRPSDLPVKTETPPDEKDDTGGATGPHLLTVRVSGVSTFWFRKPARLTTAAFEAGSGLGQSGSRMMAFA